MTYKTGLCIQHFNHRRALSIGLTTDTLSHGRSIAWTLRAFWRKCPLSMDGSSSHQYTVRCRYNAVSFLLNPHYIHHIARLCVCVWGGGGWGVFCEFTGWYMFCHPTGLCEIMTYWAMLQRHPTENIRASWFKSSGEWYNNQNNCQYSSSQEICTWLAHCCSMVLVHLTHTLPTRILH